MLPWCLTVLVVTFVALLVAVEVRWSPLLELDRSVAVAAYRFTASRPGLAHAARVVQRLFGTEPVTACTVLAAALLALRGLRRAAATAVAVMVVTAAVTTVVKVGVDRERPQWSAPLSTLSSPSFPSGHSSSIAAAAVLTMVALGVLTTHRWARRVGVILATTVVLGVGADRLLLGVHYLSDVLAGYALGLLVALCLVRLTRSAPATADDGGGCSRPDPREPQSGAATCR